MTSELKNPIDWGSVRRVLLIRLRSIGDIVLATPCLTALRDLLPNAEIDILVERRFAGVLEGFAGIGIIPFDDGTANRLRTAEQLRRKKYDVVFNLHGGTTSGMMTLATRARYRIGMAEFRYPFAHTDLLSSSAEYWGETELHAVEQQLAILGFAGVPVSRDLPTTLAVMPDAKIEVKAKLAAAETDPEKKIALIHPATAFETKRWRGENFAETADYLNGKGFQCVAVAAHGEQWMLDEMLSAAKSEIATFTDLTIPQISALASISSLFVGVDSGIAHIAAAHRVPVVVIFGPTSRVHWRPWTTAPNRVVYEPFSCQPCPAYECREFGEPRCILSVRADAVKGAVDDIIGLT